MEGPTGRERGGFQEKAPAQDTKHLFELLVQAVVLYNIADISQSTGK